MAILRPIYCLTVGNWSDLHYAVYSENLSRIHRLMENGADIDARNDDGETPLHYACFSNSDCIEAILKYNPSMNLTERSNRLTPLIIFVTFSEHRTSTLKLMLEKGADPNLSQINGDTPLHILAKVEDHQRERAVRYALELIKFKADVNAQNNYGDTPLHSAIRAGFTELTRILLNNGAQLKSRNFSWQNPIHFVVDCNMALSGPIYEIGKYIIEQASIGRKLVSQIFLNGLLLSSDLQLFKEECDQEVLELKSTVIDGSFVTYYDFLVLPLDDVGRFLRNEDILEAALALGRRKTFMENYSLK
ncbi:hypothetical protein WA026_023498 [Henosepilachna vigintioctopunctata]|uniref:Uncharacterized protein n=1 Tax=Henosepilachna vigintioctopunctata TaxID=420089 RepID=A0AAW1UDC6_9CUCU